MTRFAKVGILALLACACGRRTVDKSLQAELDSPDVVPGLIDVQFRGIDAARRGIRQRRPAKVIRGSPATQHGSSSRRRHR